MKKLSIVFALAVAFATVAVACGDDDNKDACEKAADVMSRGYDSYCDGKSDQCYFCDCSNQGLEMQTTGDGTDVTFSCVQPTASTCDASSADAAGDCLDDESACESTASSLAQTLCDGSAK